MNAPYTISFDAASEIAWDVLDASGELVVGFYAQADAEAECDALNDEASEEAEILAWEAGRAAEHAEDNRIADMLFDDPEADV